MNYRTAGAFRDALEKRLYDHSNESGIPMVRLRKAVVFDRLLARLLQSDSDRWLLKGALALDFRLGSVTRTTMDMDVEYSKNWDGAEADLIAVQTIDLGDFFAFELARNRVSDIADTRSISYLARAELAGRIFEEVVVDVGIAEPVGHEIEHIPGTNLLEFAEIERIKVPVLPIEQHVAEKVHAYTRIYGDGMPSSRVKDLIDLVLIESYAVLDAEKLREFLEVTFEARALQPLPRSLPPPPDDWSTSYRVLAKQVGINEELSSGHAQATKFIDPVLSNNAKGQWDPDLERWVIG